MEFLKIDSSSSNTMDKFDFELACSYLRRARDPILKRLVACNCESDTLDAALQALEDGLIHKDILDNLTSLPLKVSTVLQRRISLLEHVQRTLQERLLEFEPLFLNCDNESAALAIAKRAVSAGVLERSVLVRLASLDVQVPTPMRIRYLLMCIYNSLSQKLTIYEKRILAIGAYQCANELNVHPLKFAEDAEGEGLISKSMVDYLYSLYPKGELRYESLAREIHMEELKVGNLVKRHGKFLLHSNSPSRTDDSILGPRELPMLSELLSRYAHKWRSIGIALSFQPEDLDSIGACIPLISGSPQSFLIRVLEEWLLQRLQHALPPTVSSLQKALSSEIVGLGRLANELKLMIKKKSSQSIHALPYSIISTSLAANKFPIKDDVYVEENKSTLLEVKIIDSTSAKDKFLYQWNDIEHSQGPILCIRKVDIDLDGTVFTCQLTHFVQAAHITLHVSCPLDKFRRSLALWYLAQPEVPEDTWPPIGAHKHLNLAIIKQQKVNYKSEYARFTVRGDVDDILQDKQKVEYKEIYKSLKCGILLLIEGRPGSGKTTFIHKLAQDWAAESELGAIRLLLLVSLRVLNTFTKPNLSDILKLFKDLNVDQSLIEERAGKGVCFIFDGLDEFTPPEGKRSVVYQIINKTYLNQSTVIVASRPAATAKLRQRADKVIEVLGFLSDQILQFFDLYPFSSTSKSFELKEYLANHPNIFQMCYLPIHATMVAYLYEVTGKVPKTETEIYKLFTNFAIMRSLSKNELTDVNDINIQCLSEEDERCFKLICQLAFDLTLLNKQVLHQDEVSSYFKVQRSGDISLGLITVDRTADLYGFKDIYTFLHLTYQEYLGAYHISTLNDEEQVKLIEEHGHKSHMLIVWKFYCGLIDVKPFENKFKLILNKTEGNPLFQLQCAYESQQKIACAQVLKTMHYHIQLSEKYLSIPDFTTLGYVTNSTVISTKLSIINCNVDIQAIDAVLSEMQDGARNVVHGLHIETEVVDEDKMKCIIKLLLSFKLLNNLVVVSSVPSEVVKVTSMNFQLSNLTELFLKNTESLLHPLMSSKLTKLHYIGCVKVLAECLKYCKNLKELDLIDNNISDGNSKVLAKSLKNCDSLEEINISNTNISSSAVAGILESTRHCKLRLKAACHLWDSSFSSLINNLRVLDISVNMNDSEHFFASIRSCKQLKELHVCFVHMGLSKSATNYELCLKELNELQALTLKDGISNIQAVRSLMNGIQHCPNLQKLNLSNNYFSSDEVKVMASNLTKLSLMVLHLNRTIFGDDAIEAFCSYLQYYPSLLDLNLGYNNIGRIGAMALATNLHHCKMLQKLNLQHNNIDDQEASAIVTTLKLSVNFQSLNISDNPCDPNIWKSKYYHQ